jgi:hypothetical protein
LVATVLNLTASLGTFTVAWALVAASMDAEPATAPPASSRRREIGVEPSVWGFVMLSSLTTHDALLTEIVLKKSKLFHGVFIALHGSFHIDGHQIF